MTLRLVCGIRSGICGFRSKVLRVPGSSRFLFVWAGDADRKIRPYYQRRFQ